MHQLLLGHLLVQLSLPDFEQSVNKGKRACENEVLNCCKIEVKLKPPCLENILYHFPRGLLSSIVQQVQFLLCKVPA